MALISLNPIEIFGDGSTTRDFCYIANVIQANLLAATVDLKDTSHAVVNVAIDASLVMDFFMCFPRSGWFPRFARVSLPCTEHAVLRRAEIQQNTKCVHRKRVGAVAACREP
jgi:UDP-N-acetylglucosamine 4-epimerase